VERGVSATSLRDAKPKGWFIQPSFLLTDAIELVARYQQLDTDGRGVQLADVIRSAPTGPTMNKFDEWFVGANLYLRSLDLRFQLGALSGKTKDTVTGGPAEAKTKGIRSQMQIQF
jgi:phosphate-selective porin